MMNKASKNNTKYVAYYRVSTDKQGQSGLGLEAQMKAVEDYLYEGRGVIVSKRTEIESGKKSDRPALNEALEECKRHQATLIIAKLDRLARNVHFISGLMESGVDFVAVDMPHANKFQIHLMAAFAEFERDMISERTKAGLERAKARGIQLGVNGKKLAEANKLQADKFANQLKPIIHELRAEGVRSVRAITEKLNKKGIPSATGGIWHVATVHNLLHRLDGKCLRRNADKKNMKARAMELKPLICEIRKAGVSSLRATAAMLNKRGIPSFRGGQWHPNTVKTLLTRIGIK